MGEAVSEQTIDRLRIALGRIARNFDRQASDGSLTRTQLSVLATVNGRGPIGLGDLADIEGINPTMLSRVIGKLEEAGLVQRRTDPDDRRAVRVEVSAEGAKLRHRVLSERSRLLGQRLEGLPPDEVATLIAAVPALEALGEQLALGLPVAASVVSSAVARRP
jgi:DNA-binding MarR family transcriptional regulator